MVDLVSEIAFLDLRSRDRERRDISFVANLLDEVKDRNIWRRVAGGWENKDHFGEVVEEGCCLVS